MPSQVDSLDDQLHELLTHRSIEQFLFQEAALLDEHRFSEWIELFADDLHYVVPMRVVRERQADWSISPRSKIFDDNKQTLAIRVQRLGTDYAWAEQPPSRTRHSLSNIRISAAGEAGEYDVECNFMIYRSRGDQPDWVLVSGQRRDLIRSTADGWRIARRWATLDQRTTRIQNLSFFL